MPRIALERADTEPVSFDERLVLNAEQLAEDVVSLDPVTVIGQLEKADDGYTVTAEVEGRGQLRCVRCLEPFPFAFRERIGLAMRPLASAPADEETRLGRADLDVLFYAVPELDLIAMTAEQVQLAVPMKPLCRQECRGLCPSCGANRNSTPCDCPSELPDERLAPLGQWSPSN